MSGHSKWHNIRVKKGAADAKRGKVFTRHAKLIEIVAQKGGDPTMNPSLRTAIDNAKADSVPNANIERAIKKGTGELKGEAMQELTHEAYGPGGAALIIECLTDNKNRTLSNVKLILSKNSGRMAESGSVMWMFERRGVVTAQSKALKTAGKLSEDIELGLIEVGADDIETDQDLVTVTTDMTKWTAVRDFLKAKGFEISSAGLQYVPKQTAPIDTETMAKVEALIVALEEDDDVSEVHTNATVA